jgi:hypothetical protein
MFKTTLTWQIVDFLFSKNTTFARIKEISQSFSSIAKVLNLD